jgi:hypothetical protein
VGVVDPGQVFIIDLDDIERRLGDFRGVGGEQRHRLAVVTHPVLDQNGLRCIEVTIAGLAGNVGLQLLGREIVGGQHAVHAGQGFGLVHIDASNPRARPGRAQHGAMNHTGHDHVAGVGRGAINLARRIRAR